MTAARPDTWMPMYWGDYARDTGHLSATQHGAYLMLIKHYWCTGTPLPDDDAQLWRIACCDSLAHWRKVRAVVEPFFDVEESVWHHKRVDAELANAVAKVEAKAQAGKEGAAKRWRKNGTPNGKAIADPSVRHRQTDAPSPSPSHSYESPTGDSTEGARKRATRAPKDWTPSLKTLEALQAERPDLDVQAEVVKYRDWSASSPNGAKLDHEAAFRNWVRRCEREIPPTLDRRRESSSERSLRGLANA